MTRLPPPDVMKEFFSQGKNSVIIHFRCLPWSSRPFGVSELANAFFFLLFFQKKMYQIFYLANPTVSAICLGDLFCFFQPNDSRLHLHWHFFGPHAESSKDQLPNANSTFVISSRPLICLICRAGGHNRGTGHTWQLNYLPVIWSLLNLWKVGDCFFPITVNAIFLLTFLLRWNTLLKKARKTKQNKKLCYCPNTDGPNCSLSKCFSELVTNSYSSASVAFTVSKRSIS